MNEPFLFLHRSTLDSPDRPKTEKLHEHLYKRKKKKKRCEASHDANDFAKKNRPNKPREATVLYCENIEGSSRVVLLYMYICHLVRF